MVQAGDCTESIEMPSSVDIYFALKPLYITSRLVGLAPFAFGKSHRSSTASKCLRIGYNFLVLSMILLGFVAAVLYDICYKYVKQSSSLIIPLLGQLSSLFGGAMIALIVCHRGTLQRVCEKLYLIDQVLPRSSDANKWTNVAIILETIVVFSALAAMHAVDSSGHRVSVVSVVQLASIILASFINMTIVLEFVNIVSIIQNRFLKLNDNLSSMVYKGFVEEELEEYMLKTNSGRKSNESCLHRAPHIISASLSRHSPHYKNKTFNYDPMKLHSLRLIHSLLHELRCLVNSHFGLQLLFEMFHSFITLIMSLYIAMAAKTDPHIVDCDVSSSCTRVITNFCLAAICIFKFIIITTSCYRASDEINRTPEILQKLLLPRPIEAEAFTELELFYQRLSGNDCIFTANGFFSINLNLLIQVAASATTYLVILIQMNGE